MAESSSDALPLRPMASTLLTGLFLPAHTPPPVDVPLPDAPLPHAALRLPAGGVTLFYGIHAPRWLGQALQRAQQQGYYGIGARAFATFNQVQQASRQLPLERLPEVEVLWLNRMYCTREIAERIQDHTRRYLTEAGMSLPPRHAALRFDEITQHPELLQRLLTEPEFAHLRAVVATLPGCQAPDGNRPSVQINVRAGFDGLAVDPDRLWRATRSVGVSSAHCRGSGHSLSAVQSLRGHSTQA